MNLPDISRGPFASTYMPPDASAWNLTSLQNSTYHSSYHPLFEIDEFIHQIASLYPSLTRVVHLGHSGEGREMLGLTISSGERSISPERKCKTRKAAKQEIDPTKKLGFVVVGAIHAREVGLSVLCHLPDDEVFCSGSRQLHLCT